MESKIYNEKELKELVQNGNATAIEENLLAAISARKSSACARYELKHEPEDCFGGRGNNIGQGIVEDLELTYADFLQCGYAAWPEIVGQKKKNGRDVNVFQYQAQLRK